MDGQHLANLKTNRQKLREQIQAGGNRDASKEQLEQQLKELEQQIAQGESEKGQQQAQQPQRPGQPVGANTMQPGTNPNRTPDQGGQQTR